MHATMRQSKTSERKKSLVALIAGLLQRISRSWPSIGWLKCAAECINLRLCANRLPVRAHGDESLEALAAAARSAEREREEEAHLRGIRHHHQRTIANVRRLKTGGMSRRTLIR